MDDLKSKPKVRIDFDADSIQVIKRKIKKNLAGSSLASFLELAEEAGANKDRLKTIALRFVDTWVAEKDEVSDFVFRR